MTRFGIFGGSFNPPHLGHQVLMLLALESKEIDKVLMIPTYKHAFDKGLAPFADRMKMCEAAASVFGERVEVSSVESTLEGKSRTLHTLEHLKAQGFSEMRLLIGADILGETHLWHKWDEVIALAPALVFKREGHEGGELLAPPDISSSEIRNEIAKGSLPKGLVSQAVLSYIQEKDLYKTT